MLGSTFLFRMPRVWRRLSITKQSVGICSSSYPPFRKNTSDTNGSSRTKTLQLHQVTNLLASTDSNAQQIPTLTYEEILALKTKKDIILIDVREPYEIQETGKLPDSIHIPLKEVQNALGALSEKEFKIKYGADKPALGSPVVFSCKAGIRSALAFTTATQLGYTNARSYEGGFMDWKEKSEKNKC